MLLALGLAVILYLWLALLFNQYSSSSFQINDKIKQNKQQIQEFRSDIQNILAKKQQFENKKQKQSLTFKSIEKDLAKESRSGLDRRHLTISPEKMGEAMRDIVTKNSKAKLLALKTQPSEALVMKQGDEFPPLYKKTIKLQFESDYYSTLQILRKIESLPWAVFYDTIQYQVEQYPKAKVSLIIFMLSEEERWFSAKRDLGRDIDVYH